MFDSRRGCFGGSEGRARWLAPFDLRRTTLRLLELEFLQRRHQRTYPQETLRSSYSSSQGVPDLVSRVLRD
jgi:hypothetical protein